MGEYFAAREIYIFSTPIILPCIFSPIIFSIANDLSRTPHSAGQAKQSVRQIGYRLKTWFTK